MTMTEKFKIVTTFIRDMSSETPNVETYFFAKNNITKYQLNINIDTKPIKNQHVEVDTVFKFQDIEENTKYRNICNFYTLLKDTCQTRLPDPRASDGHRDLCNLLS